MLEHLHIKGFRALKDCVIDLPKGRPLVLIGENATGKSTILDAVSVLAALASGGGGRAILDRGGWDAVTWGGGGGEIELVARFAEGSPGFEAEDGPVEYMVRLGHARSVPTVLDEEVRVYRGGLSENPFVALKGGARRSVYSSRLWSDVDAPSSSASDDPMVNRPVLAQVTDEALYPMLVRLREALRSMVSYPSFALGTATEPGAEPLGSRPTEMVTRIKRSGRDLVNALHTLSQDAAVWRALSADLRAVFPWCGSLNFPPGGGRGLITLTWVDARSGAKLYLDDMSEGMRVYLALLAALHAPDHPALLAFDEPERSLHPHALRRLVKVIESRAERTPVIVATHSDRLLDYLEEPAETLRITRFSSSRGVTLERLDPGLMEAWLRDYTLSELRAREVLESTPDEESAGS
jgi:predicted ATPase